MALILLWLAAGHNYQQSLGMCTPATGEAPEANADFKGCMARCQKRTGCTAFARPNSKKKGWCKTFTADLKTVKGKSGDTSSVCWIQKPAPAPKSKSGAPAPAPGKASTTSTAPMVKYVVSGGTGRCRDPTTKQGGKGVTKYIGGKKSTCKVECDKRSDCTGYTIPTKGTWCELYLGAVGTAYLDPDEDEDTKPVCIMKAANTPPAKAPTSEPTSEPTAESTVLEPTAEPTEGVGSGGGSGRGSSGGGSASTTSTMPEVSTTSTMPASDTVTIEWVKSDGACRDVHEDTGKRTVNTGHRFHRVANLDACMEKCAKDDGCHGIASPHVTSARHDRTWCETYTLKDGKGNGNTKFDCYMKPEFAASTSTHRSMGVGRHHRHRSSRRHRGGNKK